MLGLHACAAMLGFYMAAGDVKSSFFIIEHLLLGHLPTCFCFTSEAGSHVAQAGFNSCLSLLSTGIKEVKYASTAWLNVGFLV